MECDASRLGALNRWESHPLAHSSRRLPTSGPSISASHYSSSHPAWSHLLCHPLPSAFQKHVQLFMTGTHFLHTPFDLTLKSSGCSKPTHPFFCIAFLDLPCAGGILMGEMRWTSPSVHPSRYYHSSTARMFHTMPFSYVYYIF
ncbi:hypothetical protein SCLCIDRAFT_415228 [Scleroderma citrinum Foug A]|uniref:Uncharacterized protein n=1 Tax=Scleroderma citrinum Foug A TaxID=1036808 RepID=A0A0C3ALF0_9AGAM|nr:hypothetical protein SCLCIDRAFT_415228 [Scleroderma citrinum Foug A]